VTFALYYVLIFTLVYIRIGKNRVGSDDKISDLYLGVKRFEFWAKYFIRL